MKRFKVLPSQLIQNCYVNHQCNDTPPTHADDSHNQAPDRLPDVLIHLGNHQDIYNVYSYTLSIAHTGIQKAKAANSEEFAARRLLTVWDEVGTFVAKDYLI